MFSQSLMNKQLLCEKVMNGILFFWWIYSSDQCEYVYVWWVFWRICQGFGEFVRVWLTAIALGVGQSVSWHKYTPWECRGGPGVLLCWGLGLALGLDLRGLGKCLSMWILWPGDRTRGRNRARFLNLTRTHQSTDLLCYCQLRKVFLARVLSEKVCTQCSWQQTWIQRYALIHVAMVY